MSIIEIDTRKRRPPRASGRYFRPMKDRLDDLSMPLPWSGCIIWMGNVSDAGYGRININKKLVNVHRIAYEIAKGPIPPGLVIDHLCRVRSCINPDHLEAVTDAVNCSRGFGIPALNARKTHCHKGHPFLRRASGKRCCPVCDQAKWARHKHKYAYPRPGRKGHK